MDPHAHPQHHQIDQEPPLPNAPYYFAPDDQAPYALAAYPHPTISPYPVQVQHPHGQQTRALELQTHQIQQQPYHPAVLIPHSHHPQHHQYPQSPSVYPSPPPHALPLPTGTPPPPSPPEHMYDPLSPPLSGSDTSADGLYQGSNSSGANSPTSSRAPSLVHRGHVRYDPTPSPTGSIPRHRRRGRSQDSDDDDLSGLMYNHASDLAHNRKEATRRQRIEAEQRRRDELRDGYAKLKDVLPVSNQKSSKVSLLDRATTHIVALESENKALQDRIASLEEEIRRLQSINEKLAGGALQTPSPGMYERPLSPPPEVTTLHPHSSSSLAGATGLPEHLDDGTASNATSTPSESGAGF